LERLTQAGWSDRARESKRGDEAINELAKNRCMSEIMRRWSQRFSPEIMEGKEGLGFHGAEGKRHRASDQSLHFSPVHNKVCFVLPARKCLEAPYGCPDFLGDFYLDKKFLIIENNPVIFGVRICFYS
jgi:hypothetical protein